MRPSPRFRRYLRLDLRRGAQLDADIDAELRFHVESRIDDLLARGTRPDVARETAIREFGDLQRITDACRGIGRQRERDMLMKEWGFGRGRRAFGCEACAARRRVLRLPRSR